MRGRGRGGPATGRFPQVSSNRGDGKTLQVKKIPPELNNIAKLNEHFATFGSIVNMQVRFNGEPDSALISYASRHEAMAAYKSPQPVLNNRFIKVFFYNPDVVAGSAIGQDMATIENSKFVNQELKETREKIIEAKRKLKAEKAAQISLFNVHKRQTDLLQKLVDRQKVVVMKLKTETDTLEPAEKKKLLGVVKKMMDKVTAGRKEIHDLSAKLKSCTESIAELEKVIASETTSHKEKSSNSDGRDSASPSSPKQEGKVAMFPTQNFLKRKAQDGGDVEARFHSGGTVRGKDPMVLLTFRSREDADQAVMDGGLFKGAMLDVTWHRRSGGSGENSPLSADKMLASILQSESDDECKKD
ncbi:hypothetical protein OSTOST_25582 [Ostertagia ostertagi]